MVQNFTQQAVRCYWAGTLQLTNGQRFECHCTQITSTQIEVEIPSGIMGSSKVMLEINAFHNGKGKKIKAICQPVLDILNEHDQHYIRLKFVKMGDEDKSFISRFISEST